MKTSSQHPKPVLYLLLLAIQVFGAIVFVCQQLPEFRQVAVNPGVQLPRDAFSDLANARHSLPDANLVLVPGTACPDAVSATERGAQSRVPVSGPSQFHLGSALFSVVVFRHLPELGRDTDVLLMAGRGIILVGNLFALFCASLEVERLGQAFEGPRN